MKLKIFVIASLLFALSTTTIAQNYRTGIGARAGFFNGVTVKSFLSPNTAFEGIAAFRWDGVAVTGLYEWQKFIPSAPGFDYFLGAGAHVGIFNNYKWDNDKKFIAGLDVILGFEYTFPTAPFTIGLDYKPAFNFIGDNHMWADEIGLSFRFNIR